MTAGTFSHRYLVHICDDLGKKDQSHDYVVKLRSVERAIEGAGGAAGTVDAQQMAYAAQQQAQQQALAMAQAQQRGGYPQPYPGGDENQRANGGGGGGGGGGGEYDEAYERQAVAAAAAGGAARAPSKQVSKQAVDDDHFADVDLDENLLPT